MTVLSRLSINADGFVFDPSTGETYTVNESGLIIIHALRENQSDPEIIRKLMGKFNIDETMARFDLRDFKYHLKSLALL